VAGGVRQSVLSRVLQRPDALLRVFETSSVSRSLPGGRRTSLLRIQALRLRLRSIVLFERGRAQRHVCPRSKSSTSRGGSPCERSASSIAFSVASFRISQPEHSVLSSGSKRCAYCARRARRGVSIVSRKTRRANYVVLARHIAAWHCAPRAVFRAFARAQPRRPRKNAKGQSPKQPMAVENQSSSVTGQRCAARIGALGTRSTSFRGNRGDCRSVWQRKQSIAQLLTDPIPWCLSAIVRQGRSNHTYRGHRRKYGPRALRRVGRRGTVEPVAVRMSYVALRAQRLRDSFAAKAAAH
jgi:hypothetical protein